MVKENDPLLRIKLPSPSPSDLRGKQSVRATFKLSEKVIETISIVSLHLGIQQKSLFDHLLEDSRTLHLIAREIQPPYAPPDRSKDHSEITRVQKTYVLSRRTLVILEETAKTYNASRDALIEHSVQRLLPVIAKERQKHRRRKALLAKLTEFMDQGGEILTVAQQALGEEDPVSRQLENVLNACSDAQQTIQAVIDRGALIEDIADDFDE